MPYISEQNRKELMWVDQAIEDVNKYKKLTAGELQYIIEQERYSDEELCISSGSNGGLHSEENDSMASVQREDAGSDGHSFTRSNT